MGEMILCKIYLLCSHKGIEFLNFNRKGTDESVLLKQAFLILVLNLHNTCYCIYC